MSDAPDQMTIYLKAMKELTEAAVKKDFDGHRAAIRQAWNLYDGLSREEQSGVTRPDGRGYASRPPSQALSLLQDNFDWRG